MLLMEMRRELMAKTQVGTEPRGGCSVYICCCDIGRRYQEYRTARWARNSVAGRMCSCSISAILIAGKSAVSVTGNCRRTPFTAPFPLNLMSSSDHGSAREALYAGVSIELGHNEGVICHNAVGVGTNPVNYGEFE